jgi:hypothetical protein
MTMIAITQEKPKSPSDSPLHACANPIGTESEPAKVKMIVAAATTAAAVYTDKERSMQILHSSKIKGDLNYF